MKELIMLFVIIVFIMCDVYLELQYKYECMNLYNKRRRRRLVNKFFKQENWIMLPSPKATDNMSALTTQNAH